MSDIRVEFFYLRIYANEPQFTGVTEKNVRRHFQDFSEE